jgi:hypothetical protein
MHPRAKKITCIYKIYMNLSWYAKNIATSDEIGVISILIGECENLDTLNSLGGEGVHYYL